MELTGDKKIEMFARQNMFCTRNTLLPYEYERTCVACE